MSTDRIAADRNNFLIFVRRKLIKTLKYETSFSRLRTQGPQTPGKLHEPSCSELPK
ncbi:MAG: hypothetical protein GY782_10925 [Gammaproteobacteria bacterium]|nr:hypothetical protein [Gammaproteobacteria bacterium]